MHEVLGVLMMRLVAVSYHVRNKRTSFASCECTYNLHTMQKDLHRRNREKIVGPLSRTPTRCRKK